MLLLEDLLELVRNHALEGQHFHIGKDAFPGEEIAEVATAVRVLRCFCFHLFIELIRFRPAEADPEVVSHRGTFAPR